MLWATNCYLVYWHHSLWENCGHLVLLPALCQPCIRTGARPRQSRRQSAKRTLSLLLHPSMTRRFSITTASFISHLISISPQLRESCLSLWTCSQEEEKNLMVFTEVGRTRSPALQLHLFCYAPCIILADLLELALIILEELYSNLKCHPNAIF